MEAITKERFAFDRARMERAFFVMGGVALNLLLVNTTRVLGIPLYLDTIGTIFTSIQCGLFYGVLVALASNLLCGMFNATSMYFAIVNVAIAMCSFYLFRKGLLKGAKGIVVHVVALALIGGILGTAVGWALDGAPTSATLAEVGEWISAQTGLGSFTSCLIASLGLNLVDKTITVVSSMLLLRLVPGSMREAIWACDPHLAVCSLPDERAGGMSVKSRKVRNARRRRLLLILVSLGLSLTAVITWVSVTQYTDISRKERIEEAESTADLAVTALNPNWVDTFLAEGESAFGYASTKRTLSTICDNSVGVKNLYVLSATEDGCRFVFDLDASGEPGYKPGELVAGFDSLQPHLPELLAGEEVGPIESRGSSGWFLSVFQPVYNNAGQCVCYVGADVSMDDLASNIQRFLLRIMLITSGFLALIITFGMQVAADYHKLDEMQMLLEKREQDRLLTKEIVEAFAKTIDMKDRYTNGHSFRVAEYTARLSGELGYDEKTVEKFYNVALLHDIGKIGIPEELLNKPGKLTDEEYRVVKSHAKFGREALKNISIMPELAIGAGLHHERPDGQGYPHGLKGDEIPRVAQIIAVADTFDAMYSNRPYRKQMDFNEALGVIRSVSGTQLQSDVVDAFLRLAERGELNF